MPGSPGELRRVRDAARKAASARQALEARIVEASAVASLRAVAAAAGISHEQVRRIVSPPDATPAALGRTGRTRTATG